MNDYPEPTKTGVALKCDRPGCSYVSFGATQRQAIARMGRHWTANDHEDHVRKILEGCES